MPLPDRINQIMEDQTATQADVGRAAGVSRGGVNYWMSSPDGTMGYEPARQLHRKWGYSMRWLQRGLGERFDNNTPDLDPEEEEVLSHWRALVPTQRSGIIAEMKTMRETNEAIAKQMKPSPPPSPPETPSFSRGAKKIAQHKTR